MVSAGYWSLNLDKGMRGLLHGPVERAQAGPSDLAPFSLTPGHRQGLPSATRCQLEGDGSWPSAGRREREAGRREWGAGRTRSASVSLCLPAGAGRRGCAARGETPVQLSDQPAAFVKQWPAGDGSPSGASPPLCLSRCLVTASLRKPSGSKLVSGLLSRSWKAFAT